MDYKINFLSLYNVYWSFVGESSFRVVIVSKKNLNNQLTFVESPHGQPLNAVLSFGHWRTSIRILFEDKATINFRGGSRLLQPPRWTVL